MLVVLDGIAPDDVVLATKTEVDTIVVVFDAIFNDGVVVRNHEINTIFAVHYCVVIDLVVVT